MTSDRSLGPGEETVLFFMPKILTSGSLKCHEIPLVVLLRTVLLKTRLRVQGGVIGRVVLPLKSIGCKHGYFKKNFL